MKRADVRQKMIQFMALLREEQELRDQAAQLVFLGPERDMRDAVKAESDLLKKIEVIRQEKMMPLLEELSRFVSLKMPKPVPVPVKAAPPRPVTPR